MYVCVCVCVLNPWNYQHLRDQQRGTNQKEWDRARKDGSQEIVPRKEYSTGPRAAKSSERRTKKCPINLATRVSGDLDKNNFSRLGKAKAGLQ